MEDKRMLTLDELLKMLGTHAHRLLLEEQETELMPIYHIVGDDQMVIGCPWRNDEEKLAILAEIKKVAHEHNATMIGFLCEMWMLRVGPDVDLTTVDSPSQSPERIEAVLAIATDGMETKVKTWLTIRNKPGGTILSLEPQEEGPADKFTGRMIDGLLPRPSLH